MARPQSHYSVLAKSRPGQLAKLTEFLIKEDVRIGGITLSNVGDETSIGLLTRHPGDLSGKLQRSGFRPRAGAVFQAKVPLRPRVLHSLVRALAQRGVRILSLASMVDGARDRLILEVDKPVRPPSALARLGFTPLR